MDILNRFLNLIDLSMPIADFFMMNATVLLLALGGIAIAVIGIVGIVKNVKKKKFMPFGASVVFVISGTAVFVIILAAALKKGLIEDNIHALEMLKDYLWGLQ